MTLGTWQCNWNPVCNGAANSGWVCAFLGGVFYIPAVVGLFGLNALLRMVMIPGNFPIYFAIPIILITVLISGMLVGTIVQMFFPKVRTRLLVAYIALAFVLLCCLVTLGSTVYHLK